MVEYINREAILTSLSESYDALKNIYNRLEYEDEKAICKGQLVTFTEAMLRIKEQPAADVAPVVLGRWIEYKYETVSVARGRKIHNTKNHCSVCHESNGRKKTNYCSNCGAKMDLEDTEHENQT